MKKVRKVVTEEGWHWWRLRPEDEWTPRYFVYNPHCEKWIIRGINSTPTRCAKEGILGELVV